jgi:hypothetical protein
LLDESPRQQAISSFRCVFRRTATANSARHYNALSCVFPTGNDGNWSLPVQKDQARFSLIKVRLKPATRGHSSTVTGGDQFPLCTPHPKGTQKKEGSLTAAFLFFLAKLGQLGTRFFQNG